MTDAAHFHTLSPIAIDLGIVAIRWYGLSYVLGFICAYFLMRAMAKRSLISIPADRVADAMVFIIVGVLVGGRLGYALIYDRPLLYTFTDSFPWWNLLAINKGGMASHGGMIGVILASYFIARGFKRPDGTIEGHTSWPHVLDVLALCTPIGFFFGRLANYINGELLGKVIAAPGQPGPWYSVRFPQELLGWSSPAAQPGPHTPPLEPEQFTELTRAVASVQREGESWHSALERLVAKASVYREKLEPLVSARHPSQIYAAFFEGLLVFIAVWAVAARPRKPGIVGAIWLIAYGVARVVNEIWRLPDAQFGNDGRPYGLSRGQWLSLAMVVVGLAALWVCARRNAAPMMGWRQLFTSERPNKA